MKDLPDVHEMVAFFTDTERGARVLAAARGEMPVQEVFALTPQDTDMARTLLILWAQMYGD